MSVKEIAVSHYRFDNRRTACVGIWYRDNQARATFMHPKKVDSFIARARPGLVTRLPSTFERPRMRRYSIGHPGETVLSRLTDPHRTAPLGPAANMLMRPRLQRSVSLG